MTLDAYDDVPVRLEIERLHYRLLALPRKRVSRWKSPLQFRKSGSRRIHQITKSNATRAKSGVELEIRRPDVYARRSPA